MPWATEAPTPQSAGDFLDSCELSWAERTAFEYSIREPTSGQVIGACGLMRRIGPRGLEVGYWVHVNHVQQGIATAAAGALTNAGLWRKVP